MSPEERILANEEKRKHQASERAKMSPDAREDNKEQDRLRKISSRDKMSPETKADTKEQDRLRKVSSRHQMSPEKKADTKEQDRLRKVSSRHQMSPEKKADIKEQDRLHKVSSRHQMSPEKKADTKEQDRLRKVSSRHQMSTEEQNLQRQENTKSRATKRKLDKQKVISIQEAAENFHRKCCELPEYVCTCCHRLLWKQSVVPFKIENYNKNNDVIKNALQRKFSKRQNLVRCTFVPLVMVILRKGSLSCQPKLLPMVLVWTQHHPLAYRHQTKWK